MSKVPVSLRFTPELEKRLEEAAKRLRLKKHTLAQMAIEAAVEAIEANGFKLALPIEFKVANKVVPVTDEIQSQTVVLEEKKPEPSMPKKKAG